MQKDVFLKKWAIVDLFYDLFSLFSNKQYNFLQYNVKNAHPVSGAGIRTHDHLYVSLLP